MEQLDVHLTYFIQRKIDEDVKWRKLEGMSTHFYLS